MKPRWKAQTKRTKRREIGLPLEEHNKYSNRKPDHDIQTHAISEILNRETQALYDRLGKVELKADEDE